MKIYLDNNLGVTNVEQEELTQDTIGYNILKVYIPNAVLTPYDTFTCYYGALLQNGRKVGWFAMEARTSTDADYEANYTLYKATLEQCIVSVEGKVYIGCQVLLGNSGNATLIKKNTAVVQFNVRKSVAINNDILVLDTDQTTTDVLESYKNLLKNALLTYVTTKASIADNLTTNDSDKVLSAKQGYILKGMLDALDDAKANKSTAITHTGNQLQDYSGNNVYPELDDGQIAEAKLSSTLKLKVIKDYVTPEMFGAKGDGVTDDTTAIQNALIECETKKIPLFLINTYAISSTIKVTFNKSRIEGLTSNARIIQTDGSKDILVYERTYQNDFSNIVLKNLTLIYSTYGNTDTAGIRFSQVGSPDLFGTHDSIIENVTIGRAYYGIYAGTQEPLWNINFNRITMTKIIYCAMFLGNGFGNDIQLMVKDATANPNVTRGVAFQCSAGCLIDFDIEDWTGVLFKDESAFSPIRFSKIHIERCTLEANYGAFINISNTQTTIEEILIYNCTINSSNFGNAIKYYGASATGTSCLIVNQAKSSGITFGTSGAKFSLITTIGNAVNFVSVLACTGFDYVYYPYDTLTANCYYKYKAR